MEFCPLHPGLDHWPSPYYVRFKPEHAGVRLLSLDGGGMRGIVELEVLRAVQKQLGDQIPIQAFFDLIVGTSTGGIIALGFGVKGWSIKQCTETFLNLCNQAFSKRKLQSISFLKHFVTLRHASKYETTPLREVLRDSFGDQPLFGSDGKATTAPAPKVAVSATDGSGKKAIVISNYNRRDDARKKQRKLHYEFPRPNDPDLELQIWEAAAATSAAPSYFKPFVHEPTEKTYLDGALYHNNPVRLVRSEAQLLWPDVADEHPDILVSIGTGQEKHGTKSRNPMYGYENSQRNHRRETSDTTTSTKRSGFTFMGFKQILTAMQSRFDNILHAENAWLDFCDVATTDENAFRYVRINPEISNLPSLDDVAQLKAIQVATCNALERPESRAQIKRVAHMLVASSFYYERTNVPRNVYNGYSCTGKICCRFEDDSDELRAFGDYLRNQQTKNSRLAFEIENVTEQRVIETVELSTPVISRMRQIASFSLPTPAIRVRDKNDKIKISLLLPGRPSVSERYVISGFPRVIMTEDRVLEPTPELPVSKGRSNRNNPRVSSGSTQHAFELGGGQSRPQTSRRNVSDPEVHSTPSELAASEHDLRSELSGRPTLSTRREHTTGHPHPIRPGTAAWTVSEMVPKVYQGFQKSFEIGPVHIKGSMELPDMIPASSDPSVTELPTSDIGHEYQHESEVSATSVELSRASESSVGFGQGSDASLSEAHDQHIREKVGSSSSAVYSAFEELAAARRNTPHLYSTTGPAPSRDIDRSQALGNNPLCVNTALNSLPEESDPSNQYKGDAKRPEREHRKPPLSFAAKQRLPHSISTSSWSQLRPPNSGLQHMSSASTISSIASDISEMSVADSINLDAYNQRAEEREKRERLRLMASNSSLSFSDIG
ncbi:hypothetical protein E8E12_000358 [Didymella heteroderae]|uniref:PNPLA domain-containing protein n=1 Tax=Didymella heteroderae TaxID=1769908 RepID=A0A9P5C1P6_9PLEO|nr:hypothetical protein E8E12_000358 [Didymella heteroderae]